MELEEDEIGSDGGISRPRKQRELLRRMKKAGRTTGDLREENSVRQVILLHAVAILQLRLCCALCAGPWCVCICCIWWECGCVTKIRVNAVVFDTSV